MGSISRRSVLGVTGLATISTLRAATRPPNVIIILADDLGYGDVGCYGSSIPTPNLNRMSAEGARLTDYYAGAPVCSPSRAALLTGRYPAHTGITRVLLPHDTFGLESSQTTISSLLKERGYQTLCVGKWHLGSKPEFAPTRHGFDHHFGLAYSNDMAPLPLMRDTTVVEESADQESLTSRFTEQAVNFIRNAKDEPYFLYFAQTSPHIPLVASSRYRGKSGKGAYGDAVMELDWSVGQVLDAVRESGAAGDTLVIFTSDNGPWYQGSAGRLQGRKGSTAEGGIRVPFIAYMPGRIPAGLTCGGLASAMDLLPTIAALTGPPATTPTDGLDIWPMLSGEVFHVGRDALLFFDDINLQCARWGPWKAHFCRYNSTAWGPEPKVGRMNLPLPRPELYDVFDDPSESCDIASQRPDVVATIRRQIEDALLRLPAMAGHIWRDTMSRKVCDTPSGALPIPDA